MEGKTPALAARKLQDVSRGRRFSLVTIPGWPYLYRQRKEVIPLAKKENCGCGCVPPGKEAKAKAKAVKPKAPKKQTK
jgi:hypothetical protein